MRFPSASFSVAGPFVVLVTVCHLAATVRGLAGEISRFLVAPLVAELEARVACEHVMLSGVPLASFSPGCVKGNLASLFF